MQFYHAFADFGASSPRILGIANCMFISHRMLEAIKNGARKENALDPWSRDDGAAVFWIAAVITDMPGIAAKCLTSAFEQFSTHPECSSVDCIGLVCTGPKGYLMSRVFGMETTGAIYKDEWLIMEKAIDQQTTLTSSQIAAAWKSANVRNCIRQAHLLWGPRWKYSRWLEGLKR